jgi:hypothetical protein
MRIIRAICLAMLLSGALLATSLSSAKDARAFAAHFCGSVQFPGTECYHPTQSHWDRVRSRYPGPQAHNVYACVYMYNYSTNQIRGQFIPCAHTWETNPMGHNYGVTNSSDYKSFNRYPSYNGSSHTIVGWTSDNQTDG